MKDKLSFGLSVNTIKIIALAAMILDHIGMCFFDETTMGTILRGIGRISFPLFAFALVEGFVYTKDIKKYMIRVGIFALVSEIPYDLMHYGTSISSWCQKQNVMFTLFTALLMLQGILYIRKKYSDESWVYDAMVISCAMFAAFVLRMDYSYAGVLLVCVFYYCRYSRIKKTIGNVVINVLGYGGLQIFGSLSAILIWLYKGKKGKWKCKYLFYIAYPLHMLIIYLIGIV